MGLVYLDLGDAHKAIEYHMQALNIAREISDRRGEGFECWNLALALDQLGQRTEAIARAKEASGIFESIEDPDAEKVRRKLAEWQEPVTQ